MEKLLFMSPDVVSKAYNRIKNYINKTPLLQNDFLNSKLSSNIYFKFEGAQKTGSFKLRGALNTLLTIKEDSDSLKNDVVSYSSGNHAQGVAYAAKLLRLKSTIYIPKVASRVKILGAKAYGANVIVTENRIIAENNANDMSNSCYLIPPYDNDSVIAGQGTSVFEAFLDEGNFDAVFAPCGGGGLISVTYLGTKLFSDKTKVFAVEPEIANDAYRSYKSGVIQGYIDSPMTFADGVRTLRVSERTFQYIKMLDGFYESSEGEIIKWTQWMTYLLKVNIEPTSVLGMIGAFKWINEGNYGKKILIIVTGGNIDQESYLKIWKENYLNELFA